MRRIPSAARSPHTRRLVGRLLTLFENFVFEPDVRANERGPRVFASSPFCVRANHEANTLSGEVAA